MNIGYRVPLIVLGDSHVRYIKKAIKHGLFSPRDVDVCEVRGATVGGLQNPNSVTQATENYLSFIADKDHRSAVMIHLGEVDCGIGLWRKAQKAENTPFDHIDQMMANYEWLVRKIQACGFDRIIISGATLPTIKDGEDGGKIARIRRLSVRASQLEQTTLTLAFNAALSALASRLGVHFLDLSRDVLDEQTGMVAAVYQNKNPENHHMDNGMAAIVWAKHVNQILKEIDPIPGEPIKLVARRDSFIKTLARKSSALPEDNKIFVKRGDHIHARIDAVREKDIIVDTVVLSGNEIPLEFRILYRKHWAAR